MRLGIFPKHLRFSSPIWIHAVSVGEIFACRKLIDRIRDNYPGKQIVISTVTATGNKIARTLARADDFVFYLPLDFSFIVRHVIGIINPAAVIIAETEIWPNLITALYSRNIPVVMTNGRISENSYKGYQSIKLLLRAILNKVNLFCVRTETDAQRLVSLGVLKDKVKITGNMKFDNADFTDKRIEDNASGYKAKLGLAAQEKLWVCGSTHQGEEEIILGVYRDLLAEAPYLRLLIAPRHPQRAKDIGHLMNKYGFNAVRVSRLTGEPASQLAGKRVSQLNPQTVFILDTIGELVSCYAASDIVFVGGSLIKKGGQNILEPAALGKTVLFGPNMSNFRDIADLFIMDKAGIPVNNQAELRDNIRHLLKHPEALFEFGRRAREVVFKNQGATDKNIECIRSILKISGVSAG